MSQRALQAIDESFPKATLRRTFWYRAHGERPGADRGCWHYASVAVQGTRQGGRFDLPSPRGTCYFAATELAAARERLGRPGNVVSTDEIDGCLVTKVRLVPEPIANLLDVRAAQHGVTRELSTSVPYSISQWWAAALAAAGFAGIQYQPRLSTDDVRALAVFGTEGIPHPLPPVGKSRDLAAVFVEHGYTVLDAPTVAGLGELLD